MCNRPTYHFSQPLASTTMTTYARSPSPGPALRVPGYQHELVESYAPSPVSAPMQRSGGARSWRTLPLGGGAMTAPTGSASRSSAHLSYEPLHSSNATRPATSGQNDLAGVGAEQGRSELAQAPNGRPIYTTPGSAPQKAGASARKLEPIVSSTLWEDERTIVMQVLVDGHVVARRADNDWINSTKLLNMAGLTRGKRDMYLKNEPERIVFRRGALHLKGVWLPLSAAARLAKAYTLYDKLYPLFETDLQRFLFTPVNLERTTQLVRAARGRESLPKPPNESAGLSVAQQEERERRGEALSDLLKELEQGVGIVRRGSDASAGSGGTLQNTSEDRESTPEAAPSAALPAPPQPDWLQPDYRPLAQFHATGAALPRKSLSAYSLGATVPSYAATTATSTTFSFESHSGSSAGTDETSSRLGLPRPFSLPTAPCLYAPAEDRRPSTDMSFSRDYRQPVSWFDNPTPPEGALAEYTSAGNMARRLSVASSAMSVGEELEAVHEDEETNEWGAWGVMARSRPPIVDNGAGVRRMSGPTHAGISRGIGVTDIQDVANGGPSQLPPAHVRAHSVPPAFDYFPPYASDTTQFDPFSLSAGVPAPAHPAPPPTLDYSHLLASLSNLTSDASPSAPLKQSPLARFGATRLSIDSAVEAVYPHVGLGTDSLVAPHSLAMTEGGSYSWAASPATYLPSGGGESSLPYAGQQEQPTETRSAFAEEVEAFLRKGNDVSANSAETTAEELGFLSPSASASPALSPAPQPERAASAGLYSFPASPGVSALPKPKQDDLRLGHKRVLDELDAAEASSSFLSPHDSSAAVSPTLSRSGSIYRSHAFLSGRDSPLSPGSPHLPDGHPRLSTPEMRRDSLIDVFAAPAASAATLSSQAKAAGQSGVSGEGVDGTVNVEGKLSPTSAKRRKVEEEEEEPEVDLDEASRDETEGESSKGGSLSAVGGGGEQDRLTAWCVFPPSSPTLYRNDLFVPHYGSS
ncbi:hypothetical protein JCM11641_007314 [Rhodosporidiobolus odoratus]